MMRAYALKSHGYAVRTEMTSLSLRVCSMDEDKSKVTIVQKNFYQSCSTDVDESKGLILNKTLLQSCSTDEE